MNPDKKTEKLDHKPKYAVLELLKYIGPGLLVTVGFVDPGNWASNLAAGATFGYSLLWVLTLSTVMLIILQHNVAHLGIATGLCLAEATERFLPPWISRVSLASAMGASVATTLAELLGAAIALQMLFGIPIGIGALLVAIFSLIMLATNTYRLLERFIIAMVSLIGLSFLYELSLVRLDWFQVGRAVVTPTFPETSIVVILSMLGSVVMPHNLFLHSEVIQSRQWNLEDDAVIRKQLRFEFLDTLLSMLIGFAINAAILLLAVATFFSAKIEVTDLSQAKSLLEPLLGANAGVVFAVALLMSGFAATITSGVAGGSIFAGIFGEPYDFSDSHSRWGVVISFFAALLIIWMLDSPFQGLIYSQMALSMQLPVTIFLQTYLTSSKKVMGKFANSSMDKVILVALGGIVVTLNIILLVSMFK